MTRVRARRAPTSVAAAPILFERGSAARRAPHATPGGRETPSYIVVMERTHSLTSFSDDDLLRRLSDLLGLCRRDEADLVAHIGEVDRRRLYAREASPSMFSVLHRGPPPLRGRGLPPHRGRPRRARASPPPDPARRREAAPDGHREAGAAPDPGEPGGHPEPGRPPVEARDRGARGGALAPSGCSGGDAEAARPTGGDDVAGPPTRPGRRGACRTASGGRRFGRSPTPSGRSRGGLRRTASQRRCHV